MLKSVSNRVRQFHNDERGTVSLESIAVFAVGALVLGGLTYFWKGVKIGESQGISGKVVELVGNILGMKFTGE
jgi:hypothetical protein